MRYPGSLAVSILAFLALGGCRSATEFEPASNNDFALHVVPCEDFVIPNQFGLGWRHVNHRISVLKIRLDDESCDDAGNLDVGFVGGGYSRGPFMRDQPSFEFGWQRVQNQPGIAATRVSIQESVSTEGVTKATLSLAREAVHMLDYDHVVAIIQGVEFRAGIDESELAFEGEYDVSMGYTSRGLGVSVHVADTDDDLIQLDYRIRFETGEAPDRPNLNSALERAEMGAVIDVLLVGMNDEAARYGEVSFGSHYKKLALGPRGKVLPPEDERMLALRGQIGGPSGVFGFSSFDFSLDFKPRCRKSGGCDLERLALATDEFLPGGYIRKLLAGVHMIDYDEDSGTVEFRIDGYASTLTKSLAMRPMQQRFDAGIVWLQIDGSDAPRSVGAAFKVGEAAFPLTAASP